MDEGEPPLRNEVPAAQENSAAQEVERPESNPQSSLSIAEERQRLLGQVALRVLDTIRLEVDLAELVTLTHEAGVSWREIGIATGISGQVARRRWNPAARLAWADYQRRYQQDIRERARQRKGEQSLPRDGGLPDS
jgi:hypothetical protein